MKQGKGNRVLLREHTGQSKYPLQQHMDITRWSILKSDRLYSLKLKMKKLLVRSVTQSCPTLCDLMDCSMSGFPVYHQLLGPAQTMSIESGMPSNHLILCPPRLLLPSVFPNIRVFSSELALCIRWPKSWGISFSIRPSSEYSGLVSFRMACCDLLAAQGTLSRLP